MSKRVFASIVVMTLPVLAGCARPFSAPQPPAAVPAADHTVNVVARDPWWGGCELQVTPNRVNARNGQSIRWVLSVRDEQCGSANMPVKIVMKWKDCGGRPNSEEPLDLDPPGMGYQTGRVKPGAVKQQQCYQYGVFAGSLYKDPELILDI